MPPVATRRRLAADRAAALPWPIRRRDSGASEIRMVHVRALNRTGKAESHAAKIVGGHRFTPGDSSGTSRWIRRTPSMSHALLRAGLPRPTRDSSTEPSDRGPRFRWRTEHDGYGAGDVREFRGR